MTRLNKGDQADSSLPHSLNTIGVGNSEDLMPGQHVDGRHLTSCNPVLWD